MKSPWKWNELWRMNKDQIKNPHRIYPGDVLVLTTGADGQPQISLEPKPEERPTVRLSPQVRMTPIDSDAIPSIPPAIIDPFLIKPLVIEQNGLESAPRIIGGADGRVVLSAGYKIYVLGIGERDGPNWQIYRYRGGRPPRQGSRRSWVTKPTIWATPSSTRWPRYRPVSLSSGL